MGKKVGISLEIEFPRGKEEMRCGHACRGDFLLPYKKDRLRHRPYKRKRQTKARLQFHENWPRNKDHGLNSWAT